MFLKFLMTSMVWYKGALALIIRMSFFIENLILANARLQMIIFADLKTSLFFVYIFSMSGLIFELTASGVHLETMDCF